MKTIFSFEMDLDKIIRLVVVITILVIALKK